MSIFSKVALAKPKQSTFNLSYDRKMSFDMGYLIPCHLQEIVPGDKISMNTQQMLRFMPMVAPVMHEMNVYVHYWFVPNRILWKGWEDFITGGEDGLDATLFPTVTNLPVETGSLADHLGLPLADAIEVENNGPVSLLPFLAYGKIFNEYYRDQNLVDPLRVEDFTEGENNYATAPQYFKDLFSLQKRAWNHDYFTSALPWAQKGNPVSIPVVTGGQAPVTWSPNGQDTWRDSDNGDAITYDTVYDINLNANGHPGISVESGSYNLGIDNSQNLKVDLEDIQTNAASINDLRRAFKLQEWLEKNARAGSRYVESILAHFGVKSSDARLQRPEYLGGSMSPVMVSEVLQTSQTDTSPQGNMAGHGLNLGHGNGFNRFFEEHGYVMAIISVMPKTAYQQGIPRHFTKFDKFDYFWPEFENIGEQPIKNKELLAWSSDGEFDPDGTFGYIPRYSEYKFNPSTVHGDFKNTLDFWHLGRIFDSNTPPVLNDEFVNCTPRRDIFAVEESGEARLLCHMFHNIKAKRRMSYFGSPGGL